MKALGIVRRLDALGRVVIPAEIRRIHNWADDTPIEMLATEEGLLLRKYEDRNSKAEIANTLLWAVDQLANEGTPKGKEVGEKLRKLIPQVMKS